MASDKLNDTNLEDGLLTVTTDEKRTLMTNTPDHGLQHTSPSTQRPRPSRMARACRFTATFAVCLLVGYGLTSAVMPSMRCTRHHAHGADQASLPASQTEVSQQLAEAVKAAEPDFLHRLLQDYFPEAPKEEEDVSMAAARLAKRQDSETSDLPTEPSASAAPSVPSAAPSASNPPAASNTPSVVPSPSQDPVPSADPSTSASPAPSTTAPTEPSTTPEPVPSNPAESTTSTPSAPASSPSSDGAAVDSTTTQPASSSSTTPTVSTSADPTSDSETSTRGETTTSTTRRAVSSSAVVTTRTSTEADGDITLVTETSYVGVDPTPQTTSGADSDDADLQNAAPRASGSVLALFGALAAGLMLL
ncbi:hypothetical protein ACHAQA_000716 [Verticillium albo-atrum]